MHIFEVTFSQNKSCSITAVLKVNRESECISINYLPSPVLLCKGDYIHIFKIQLFDNILYETSLKEIVLIHCFLYVICCEIISIQVDVKFKYRHLFHEQIQDTSNSSHLSWFDFLSPNFYNTVNRKFKSHRVYLGME